MTSSIAPASPSSFAACVDGRVPRPLREDAETKTFAAFVGEYALPSGPVRLGQWSCVDDERPSSRLGPQARAYRATLALGDRIGTAHAAACGPVAALTAMLHDRGVGVEVTAFHQLRAGAQVATFVRGSGAGRAEWALGWSDDPVQSALRAVVACANRLLA
ncbi:homocitrate synthase [Mycolicibacterium rufum]|uniref:Homocitrate synthase n=1 Tax=Mycolicibacterium rufum TaxID=318424 RepID=A0A9X3BPK5_9MYCO|nr:homocitrate synthase [Mycolicibacterium rufum]MCV7070345.1 homocitrate synthase [Mycolicibacterium rufum]ULP38558.1 homocitrate synthase [Mycolicibacterium rufum]